MEKSKPRSDLKDSDEWSSDSNASSDSDSDLDLEGKQMEDLRKFFLKYNSSFLKILFKEEFKEILFFVLDKKTESS